MVNKVLAELTQKSDTVGAIFYVGNISEKITRKKTRIVILYIWKHCMPHCESLHDITGGMSYG